MIHEDLENWRDKPANSLEKRLVKFTSYKLSTFKRYFEVWYALDIEEMGMSDPTFRYAVDSLDVTPAYFRRCSLEQRLMVESALSMMETNMRSRRVHKKYNKLR